MEIVLTLRELWRRRWLVLASGLAALFIGLLLAYKLSPPFNLQSRAYTVGIASTTALLDTPSSQVVDLGDKNDASANAGSLPGRAALIATVLTTSPLKEEIAKSAGIDPRTLVAGAPAPDSALPVAPIGSISLKNRQASLLTVSTYADLPILSVNVTAPDAATAARLSNGAIKVLINHLNSLASSDGVPADRRVVVRQLGEARVATSQRGPSRKLAAVALVLIFGLLCATILIVSWLRTRWREVDGWDRLTPDDWANLTYEQPQPSAPAGFPEPERIPDPERVPRPVPPDNRWDAVR
jgi:hypothetical protein